MSDKAKIESKSPDPHADFHSGSELIESDTDSVPSESKTETVEMAVLRKTLEEVQLEAKTNWERLLRKEAELQNIQRRALMEVDNERKFGIERMARELLVVVDSFEQGLRYEQDPNLKNGIQLTYSMFLEVLSKFGIKEIDPAVGTAFDPKCHEAISVQESADIPANCIITVVQKGYFIHDRVLRAARVIVAR